MIDHVFTSGYLGVFCHVGNMFLFYIGYLGSTRPFFLPLHGQIGH
jgi:hypothetical protein